MLKSTDLLPEQGRKIFENRNKIAWVRERIKEEREARAVPLRDSEALPAYSSILDM